MQIAPMTGEDDQTELAFPHLIKWVEMAVRAQVDRAMRTLPVSSSQLFVLVLLEERGEATAAALARMMYLTPQAMTTLLGPLREQGYVARRNDETHGRKQLLRLTEKGDAILHDVRALTPAIEADLLAGFTDSERGTLRTLLGRIVRPTD